MITGIIKLLQSDTFYGYSDTIEIAKGKYEIPDTIKKGKEHLKRALKIKLKNGKVSSRN